MREAHGFAPIAPASSVRNGLPNFEIREEGSLLHPELARKVAITLQPHQLCTVVDTFVESGDQA